MKNAGEDVATRERLLAVATELFTEKGFHHVTVRELCAAAGANGAAVNYHFGGKLDLYRAVFESGFTRMGEDPMIAAPEGAEPEERIRHYVAAFVPRLIAHREGRVQFARLMRHEMMEPTPLAPWIAERLILPRLRFLAEAVGEMLDAGSEDPVVRRCVLSLHAQCVFYAHSPFTEAAMPGRAATSADAVEATVEHIVAFTLAGIRALKG